MDGKSTTIARQCKIMKAVSGYLKKSHTFAPQN